MGQPDTVRSFPASLVLVDEAAWVKNEMFLALSPMLATTDGALRMMSTPNGSRGMFRQTWKNGGAAWERYEAPAKECLRIRPEFLAREQRRMGDRRFAPKYGCAFVDNSECYFRRTSLEAASSDDYEPWDLHPKPTP